MSRSQLPPYDVVSLDQGFAYLIELPGCRDVEVDTTETAIVVTGRKDTRPRFAAYSGHMHVGRFSGRFEFHFDIPPFHAIEPRDMLEVEYREELGLVEVVVKKEQPCP